MCVLFNIMGNALKYFRSPREYWTSYDSEIKFDISVCPSPNAVTCGSHENAAVCMQLDGSPVAVGLFGDDSSVDSTVEEETSVTFLGEDCVDGEGKNSVTFFFRCGKILVGLTLYKSVHHCASFCIS